MKRYSHAALYPEVKPYHNWSPSLYFGARGFADRLVNKCWWDKFPKALIAMDAELHRAVANHPTARVDLPSLHDVRSWCKSPRVPNLSAAEFLRNHQK